MIHEINDMEINRNIHFSDYVDYFDLKTKILYIDAILTPYISIHFLLLRDR